jgi:SAM-dependent methyltransferase
VVWVAAGVVVLAVLAVLFYAVIVADGTYFGRRFVRFMYDRFAAGWSYPTDPKHRLIDQRDLLPVIEDALASSPGAVVLDVASGTGRVPQLIVNHAGGFHGPVVGSDLSARMLRSASPIAGRVALTQAAAEALPFPDASFALVTCIEAIINFGRPRRGLAEMVRVLEPGGHLVITKRSDRLARFVPGKDFTRARLTRTLTSLGCDPPSFSPYGGSVGRSEVAFTQKTS